MAELDVGFRDPSQAPEREFPEPFAEQNCRMQLIEADIVPTADGKGRRMTYKAEVLEGANAKRKVFGGINIVNANPKAQNAGQGELADLTVAVKLPEIPRDTGELLFRPFAGDVVISPARTDEKTGKHYDAKSEIRKFKFYDGTPVPSRARTATGGGGSTTPPVQTAAAAAAAPGRRPWE